MWWEPHRPAPARWSNWPATEAAASGRSGSWRRDATTLAGRLHARGVQRGDVVLTLVGNRPEWALTMLACFRQGYVVLPVHRATAAQGSRPAARRRRSRGSWSPTPATRPRCATRAGPATRSGSRSKHDASHTAPPPAELGPEDPCLITFTSGTAGEPEGRPARPALPDRPAPAGRALARAATRRPRLVHGRGGLVEVRPQRVHRALDPRRRRAAARRALRPPGAPGARSRASASTCSAWPRPSTA